MIRFETDEYELAYGHSPRGRGSWAFGTTRNADPSNKEQTFWTPGSTIFADAKKLANAWAKAKGLRSLVVLT